MIKLACRWMLAGLLAVAGCGDAGGTEEGDSLADLGPGADLLAEVAGELAAEVAEPDVPQLPPARPVVFAVTSDPHVYGTPEHTAAKHLAQCLEAVGGLEPGPEFLVITGDLTESIAGPPGDYELTPLELFAQIVAAAKLPVHPVAGNHDYYAGNVPQYSLVEEQAEADAHYAEQLGIDPWYAVTYGGVQFILLNSGQGDLWNISMGLSGSLGTEQLEWLDGLLDSGMPSVLFLHHPPELVEEPQAAVTLEQVVGYHEERVLAIFAGHLHLWSRGEFAGVPLFLTAANQDGVVYHHVRVDPEAGSVTILNEAEIDYGEPEIMPCVAAESTPVGDLSPLDGTAHHLLIGEVAAEPAGFGEYIEEAVKMMPLLIRFAAPDPSGLALPGRFSVGSYYGKGTEELPAYVDKVVGAPCLHFDTLVDDPCFVSQPFDLTTDLAKSFGLPLPAGWLLRIQLTEIRLAGKLSVVPPGIIDGHLQMGVDLAVTIADLKQIVVDQYCANAIDGCPPGEGQMPSCPAHAGPEFFEEIPLICDVKVSGLGIRMVLGLVLSVPDGKGKVDAVFATRQPESTENKVPGGYAPDLFSMKAGGNCAEQ